MKAFCVFLIGVSVSMVILVTAGCTMHTATEIGLHGSKPSETVNPAAMEQMSHFHPSLQPWEVEKRYRFSLISTPEQPVAGSETRISLFISNPDGSPVTTLQVNHERLIHMVVASRNLEEFHHVHPEDAGLLTEEALREGRFSVPVTFQSGGTYRLVADFVDQGFAVSQSFGITVQGEQQRRTRWNFSTKRKSGDLQAVLRMSPPTLLENVPANFTLSITSGGRPVTDLEHYLGAIAHLAIFREGATKAIHTHGEANPPQRAAGGGHMMMSPGMQLGPDIYFSHVFTTSGNYRIYTQFQHKGTVHVVPFDFSVEEILDDI